MNWVFYLKASRVCSIRLLRGQEWVKGLPKEGLSSIWETLKEGWYYILTLVVLVYFIFVEMLVARAPFYAAFALLITINFRKETRITTRSILRLTEDTGKMLTELMAILAGVGMIIGSLSLTETAHSLTGTLSAVGGQHRFPLLIVGAVTSFLLGIGLTISACYIFLAMLLAPSLVGLGIHEMSAHLFLVYWGSVSFITPPVALAAYAAASLAGANPMKTGFQTVRLGFLSLLIPFFFVYNPFQCLDGAWWMVKKILDLKEFFESFSSTRQQGFERRIYPRISRRMCL